MIRRHNPNPTAERPKGLRHGGQAAERPHQRGKDGLRLGRQDRPQLLLNREPLEPTNGNQQAEHDGNHAQDTAGIEHIGDAGAIHHLAA